MRGKFLLIAALLLATTAAEAHDSRPNYVEIIEAEQGVFTVHLKVPATVPFSALPSIIMPVECTTDERLATQQAGGAYEGRQDYVCTSGLSG